MFIFYLFRQISTEFYYHSFISFWPLHENNLHLLSPTSSHSEWKANELMNIWIRFNPLLVLQLKFLFQSSLVLSVNALCAHAVILTLVFMNGGNMTSFSDNWVRLTQEPHFYFKIFRIAKYLQPHTKRPNSKMPQPTPSNKWPRSTFQFKNQYAGCGENKQVAI